MFNDGYVDQSTLKPGHRVNHKAAHVERIWQSQLVWADVIANSDNPQERAHAVYMSERLTRLAAAIERGDCDSALALCTCGRGRVVWHNLCPDCLAEEDQAERDTAKSVRETR